MPARRVDLQKAKEAKQKKLLLALAPLLLILLAIQVPKLLKSTSAPAAAPPAPTVTATTPAGATTTVPAVTQLADTDVAPTPSDGQLVQFDLFKSKDPFVQQVKDASATETTPASTAGPTAPTPKPAVVAPVPPTTIGAYTTAAPPVPKTSVARIAIGGKAEDVVANGDFPAASPAFELVSFTAEQAEISVVGGSFKDGAPTLTLLRGQTLTLENTADGSRFVLVYRGAHKVPTASLPTTTTPSQG